MNNVKIYAFADEASPNIDEQITALKRNGLDGLEIRNVDGVSVSEISDFKAKEVRKKLDDAGLTVWSVGSPIGKIDIENDDFTVHTEKFRRTLEIAEILGAENIRLFSFFIPNGKNPDDYSGEVIDRLGTFLDLAGDTKITLCHENEKGIYGDIPERCLKIHNALPKLKGIFDPANFVQCGSDTLKAWDMLKDRIAYMHIKDAKADGTVVPAGCGDGNVEETVKRFISGGGKDFTIEPHLTVFEGFSHLERKGDETKISEYGYPDSNTAFDTACNAFKGLLR